MIGMFRELQRKKNKLPQESCIALLRKETRGVLSVLGDDGYPYGMPMNHYYNEADGKLYFHCGRSGHRLDALRKQNKASFCVYDKGVRKEGEWALNVCSVIAFGKVEIIEDLEQIATITRELSYKFTQDEAYIQREIEQFADKTYLLAMTIEHLCGKEVNES